MYSEIAVRQNETTVRAEFGVIDPRVMAARSANTPHPVPANRQDEPHSQPITRRDAETYEAERWDGMS